MSQIVFKMPDLGEGTVEAEIVAWRTEPGATVREDEIIVEVMTEKAAVEVPSPVSGRVVSIAGAPGDKIPVGAPLVVFETDASAASAAAAPAATPAAKPGATSAPTPGSAQPPASAPAAAPVPPPPASPRSVSVPAGAVPSARAADFPAEAGSGRIKISPANRRRAREAGIDLSAVRGSGPGGRILTADVAAAASAGPAASGARPGAVAGTAASSAAGADLPETTEIKVIGLRRVIAERLSEAKRTIPHFTYVEEVDVTELEALRQHLSATAPLTYLPFIVAALTRVLEQFPQCNATYDAARGVLIRHRPVHVGIATQTTDGLKVPVVRNAETLDLWSLARAVTTAAERARTNQSTRAELTGSTITVTSLGKLGGIVSTPVINLPEVGIIGINKAVDRPVVQNGAVVVRRMMNLSSSFDHRFVDGYDAAAMIQALKQRLEYPATIFIP